MSASIYWEPAERKRRRVDGTSSTVAQIEKIFGSLPVVLGAGQVAQLDALAVVQPDGPWRDFVRAIEDHGSIEITVSY